MSSDGLTHEQMARELRRLSAELQAANRYDLLLQALGVPLLEELRLEVARRKLSRLRITRDYRFLLEDYGNKEVELQPVHKAVYLLFLAHPEGIEFKRLSEYREELRGYYMATSKITDMTKIDESISHLVDPLDNAINEKCSRIKSVFSSMLDEYTANFYIVSNHTKKHFTGSNRIWFERKKIIMLPRELLIREFEVFK